MAGFTALNGKWTGTYMASLYLVEHSKRFLLQASFTQSHAHINTVLSSMPSTF